MPLRICQALMLLTTSDSDPDIVGPGEDRVDRVDAMAVCSPPPVDIVGHVAFEQQTVGQAMVRHIIAEAMMCVQVPIRSWCRLLLLLLWSMASAPSLLAACRPNSVVLVGFLGAGRVQRNR